MAILTEAVQGIANGAIRSISPIKKTVAVVIESSESRNLCTIAFDGQAGNPVIMRSVPVDLRNKDWFPQKGDIVVVETTRKGAMILYEYAAEYSDIRKKEKLSNDILPDGEGTCVAGIVI